MNRYTESTTTLAEAAVQQLVSDGMAHAWTNPRTGKVRYYLNIDALKDLIGLDVEFYKSGNVRHCSYIDAAGGEVAVANSRAYNRWTKTFIEDGRVYTEWALYGDDIAELIASNIAKAAEPEEDATETLGGNGVEVVFTECCGDKPAKWEVEGEDVYCDVCGKASSVVSHTSDYVYVGDGRLYGDDWDTDERRELTPEEAFTWFEDGDVLGLDNVSAEA